MTNAVMEIRCGVRQTERAVDAVDRLHLAALNAICDPLVCATIRYIQGSSVGGLVTD
jgi:hypothetical protein